MAQVAREALVERRNIPLLAIRPAMHRSAKKGSVVFLYPRKFPNDVGGWIGRSSRPASGRGGDDSTKTLLSNTDEEKASSEASSAVEMKVERLPYTRYGLVVFNLANKIVGAV